MSPTQTVQLSKREKNKAANSLVPSPLHARVRRGLGTRLACHQSQSVREVAKMIEIGPGHKDNRG